MALVGLAALPIMCLSWHVSPLVFSGGKGTVWIVLLCLTLLLNCMPVYISGSRFAISPNLPIALAATYLLGSSAAIIIIALGIVVMVVLVQGVPRTAQKWNTLRWALLFNCSTNIISIGLPATGFRWLYTRHLFMRHSFEAAFTLSAAAVCSFYIAAVLMTLLSSIFTKTRWDVIWYQSYRWTWVSTILLAPLGFIMGALMEQNTLFGLAFILMPLFAVHQGYSRHEREIATYRQGIDLLGRLMQESHPYTHGHLNRVAAWAVKIAEHLSLGAESMAQIENAAILHDIGKIAIDDGILNKIEKLSDDEWNKIKEHPSVGAEIAARMKYLEQVSLWIRHHHERVDGKGYPAGLAGDAIPIESKIICVVDAFDAMVGGPAKSDQRPYRRAKTVDEARAELVRCSGTQFDETVVNAFIEILDVEAVEEQAAQVFGAPELAISATSIEVLAIPAAAAAFAATEAAGSEAAAAAYPGASALAAAASTVVLQEAA